QREDFSLHLLEHRRVVTSTGWQGCRRDDGGFGQCAVPAHCEGAEAVYFAGFDVELDAGRSVRRGDADLALDRRRRESARLEQLLQRDLVLVVNRLVEALAVQVREFLL